MVTPLSAFFQELGAVTFFGKTTRSDEGDGRCVVGLNVRLKPVQLELLERMVDGLHDGLFHEALLQLAFKGVVKQIAVLKIAVENIAQFNHAHHGLGVLSTHQKGLVVFGIHFFHIV